MELAQRVFTELDQQRFAAFSGDSNPMHMDALTARRTQAGAPVVHGLHLLLWALETLAGSESNLPDLRSLRAQFQQFVYLGETVQLEHTTLASGKVRLSLIVAGGVRTRITLTPGECSLDEPTWGDELPLLADPTEPAQPSLEEVATCAGALALQRAGQDPAALFPAATRWLGATRIAALATSTRLVGMVCPGLHSIYSELALDLCSTAETANRLAFRVTEADPRFRSIDQEIVGGGWSGTVNCYLRTPPVEQASLQSLQALIDPTEFAGSRALIVGGSRGLGELTAKMIAAGGGEVTITWQAGKTDAERVAREINDGGGRCQTLQFDARNSAEELLAQLEQPPTHFYYFATPGIFRPQGEVFSPARLREFLTVYVDGFWTLTRALHAVQPGLKIFFPSSVAVTERPSGMTEYAMAKAAGEMLCAEMNQSMAPLEVTVVRLPRLPTDLTQTMAAVEVASPIETMLPIVRTVQAATREI